MTNPARLCETPRYLFSRSLAELKEVSQGSSGGVGNYASKPNVATYSENGTVIGVSLPFSNLWIKVFPDSMDQWLNRKSWLMKLLRNIV